MAATDKKTVLIVYAHYCDTSFNAALLQTAVKTLEGQGCDVIVSDLYSMKFDPMIGKNDIKDSEDHQSKEGHFNYLAECQKALSINALADDIVKEQEKLKKADLVIFQFPLYWFSVPAILKGWFDRVLSPGFAYRHSDHRIYEYGLLAGKKALLSITAGAPESFHSPQGAHGDLNVILYHLQRGTLQFCGFSVLQPHVCSAMVYTDQSTREKYLSDWAARLEKVWHETSMVPAVPFSEFDFSAGGVLKSDSKYHQKEVAPYVGTHLGKPIKYE